MNKAILSLIIFFLFTLPIDSQVDVYCDGCGPSEPITPDSLNRLRYNSPSEGFIIDISFHPDSQSLGVIRQSDPSSIIPMNYLYIFKRTIINNNYLQNYHTWAQGEVILRDESLANVVFHPQGRMVALGSSESWVEFWMTNADNPQRLHHSEARGDIVDMIYHPSGEGVITLEGGEYVGWHDLTDDGEYYTLPDDLGLITSIDVSVDGHWLAISHEHQLLIYDLQQNELNQTVLVDTPVSKVLFSPTDASQIYLMSNKVTLLQWNSADDDYILTDFMDYLPLLYPDLDFDTSIFLATINPDGSLLTTNDDNNCLRFWDTDNQIELESPFSQWLKCSQFTPTNNLTFSPDGLWLILGKVGLASWVIEGD